MLLSHSYKRLQKLKFETKAFRCLCIKKLVLYHTTKTKWHVGLNINELFHLRVGHTVHGTATSALGKRRVDEAYRHCKLSVALKTKSKTMVKTTYYLMKTTYLHETEGYSDNCKASSPTSVSLMSEVRIASGISRMAQKPVSKVMNNSYSDTSSQLGYIYIDMYKKNMCKAWHL